ncbi:MAG TPA: hypothetical protein VFZ16_12635 [Hyphomicrobiaceae bacterium]|nr:hypothetical protein [Hyphomicrobiaceae bacterium]
MRRAIAAAALTALFLGLGAGLGPRAAAQSTQAPGSPLSDAAVQKILIVALKNIQQAACDGFNLCQPATPRELQYPPVSLDQARAAIITGTRTALANWCGLDGDRRSVRPLMDHLRKARLNSRQMALIAVVHSIQQGITTDQLKARGSCDEATRRKLDAQLPK